MTTTPQLVLPVEVPVEAHPIWIGWGEWEISLSPGTNWRGNPVVNRWAGDVSRGVHLAVHDDGRRFTATLSTFRPGTIKADGTSPAGVSPDWCNVAFGAGRTAQEAVAKCRRAAERMHRAVGRALV